MSPARIALLFAMTALGATPALTLPIKLPDKAELTAQVSAFPAALTDLPPAAIAACLSRTNRPTGGRPPPWKRRTRSRP